MQPSVEDDEPRRRHLLIEAVALNCRYMSHNSHWLPSCFRTGAAEHSQWAKQRFA
jgi:hypothetical protein